MCVGGAKVDVNHACGRGLQYDEDLRPERIVRCITDRADAYWNSSRGEQLFETDRWMPAGGQVTFDASPFVAWQWGPHAAMCPLKPYFIGSPLRVCVFRALVHLRGLSRAPSLSASHAEARKGVMQEACSSDPKLY